MVKHVFFLTRSSPPEGKECVRCNKKATLSFNCTAANGVNEEGDKKFQLWVFHYCTYDCVLGGENTNEWGYPPQGNA